jgi:hypothetical protein
MIGVADIPAFPQERGDPLGQPQFPVDFPEKKQSRVGRHLAPQEIRLDFFAPHVLEKQPLFAMISHGCFTPRVENGFVVETILNQHPGVGTAFFMNN